MYIYIWVMYRQSTTKMETTIFGLYRDNGKEHGNYYSILGLCWDNGKTTDITILGYMGTL